MCSTTACHESILARRLLSNFYIYGAPQVLELLRIRTSKEACQRILVVLEFKDWKMNATPLTSERVPDSITKSSYFPLRTDITVPT
jgi:hypothetical protein